MSKQQSKSANTAQNAQSTQAEAQKVYKSVGEIRKVFYPKAAAGKAWRGATSGRNHFLIKNDRKVA